MLTVSAGEDLQRAGVDGSTVGLAEVRHVDLTECHAVVFKRHPLAPCDRTRQGGGVRHRHVAAPVAPLSVAQVSDGTHSDTALLVCALNVAQTANANILFNMCGKNTRSYAAGWRSLPG